VRVVGSIFVLIGRVMVKLVLTPTVRSFVVTSIRTRLSGLFPSDVCPTHLMRHYEGHHEADEHHYRDPVESNLNIIDHLRGAPVEECSFSVWLVFTGLLGIPAAGGGNLLLRRVHDVGAGPDLVAVHLGHAAAREGLLQPVPEAVGQDIALFVVQWHGPRHLLFKHQQNSILSVLMVKKYNCSDGSSKQNEKYDDETAEHATTLEGGPAAAQAGEEAKEGEHNQEDHDEDEVGGCIVAGGEVVLDILANDCVLGVEEDVDGSGQTGREDEEAQEVDEEQDEFDEVRAATSHDDVVLWLARRQGNIHIELVLHSHGLS